MVLAPSGRPVASAAQARLDSHSAAFRPPPRPPLAVLTPLGRWAWTDLHFDAETGWQWRRVHRRPHLAQRAWPRIRHQRRGDERAARSMDRPPVSPRNALAVSWTLKKRDRGTSQQLWRARRPAPLRRGLWFASQPRAKAGPTKAARLTTAKGQHLRPHRLRRRRIHRQPRCLSQRMELA